jgi:hypothetical protein
MGSAATNTFAYVDPLPILGESLPYTFMAHHWGKRGWLLTNGGAVRMIDANTMRARLLAAGGTYDSTSKDNRWGAEPVDLKGKDR